MVGPVRVDGLSSGIDYTSIIEKLMSIQKAPIARFEGRVVEVTETQTSLLQVNASLLALKGVASSFSKPSFFNRTKAASSNESVLSASGDQISALGAYTFSVHRLAQSHQLMSNGVADSDTTAVTTSDSSIRMEIGGGHLQRRTHVSFLNNQAGIDRGSIQVTDSTGTSSLIALSHVLDVQDVLDAINEDNSLAIKASVSGNKIVIEDTGGGSGTLAIQNSGTDTTATSLGLDFAAQNPGAPGGSQFIYGKDINTVTGSTSLDLLNDGLGIHHNGTGSVDFTITDTSGNSFGVDIQSSDKTIKDVLDAINNAADAANPGTNFKASLSASGNSIVLEDDFSAGNGITVTSATDSFAAADLGFGLVNPTTGGFAQLDAEKSADGFIAGDGNRLYGTSLIPSLNATKRNLLQGGQTNYVPGEPKGVQNGSVTFTDRLGNSETINLGNRVFHDVTVSGSPTSFKFNSLDGFAVGNRVRFQTTNGVQERTIVDINTSSGVVEVDKALTGVALNKAAVSIAESTEEIMRLVNDRLAAAGVGIKMDINPVSNGFQITDTSGGNGTLSVSGTPAADLGIEESVSENMIVGSDVDVQFLSINTRLSSMNGGAGIQAGKFQVFDTDGNQFTVDLTQPDDVDLGEVINDGNGAASVAGSGVVFRLNDAGDGILVEDATPGTGTLRIQEVNSGRTARDLNIEATADAATPGQIDGSFEKTIKIGAGSTLEDIAKKINQEHLGIQAMVVNDGSPTNPFRISLISTRAGEAGRLVADSDIEGFSFATTAEAQNSTLLYGTNGGSGDPVVISKSDNRVTDLVQGMTLELLSTSASPVTVTVSRDLENVEAQAGNLVEKYNDVISKFRELTYFDSASYSTGPLFGDPTVRRIESEMSGMVTLPVEGIPTSELNTLTSVGFSTTGEGGLFLDGAAFSSALQANFDEVVSVFTKQKPIKLDTKLSELSNGLGITNTGGDDFTVIARNGITKFSVDLGDNETLSSMLLKINTHLDNNNNPGGTGGISGILTASIASDGYSIQIDDSSIIASRSAKTLSSASEFEVDSVIDTDLTDLDDDRVVGSTISFTSGNNVGEIRTVTGFDPLSNKITLDSALSFDIDTGDSYTLERELQVQGVGSSPAAAQLKIQQKLALGKNSIEGGLLNLDGDPGVAARMVEQLDYFTRIGDGLISTRTDSLDDTIDGINLTIERIEERVEREEIRLVREFARLEIILAESQTTMANIQSSLLAFVSSMKTK